MTGGFHTASDINRLYTDCKKGGRGLQNIEDIYKARVTRMMTHLQGENNGNELLERVKISEKDYIMRLSQEIKQTILYST